MGLDSKKEITLKVLLFDIDGTLIRSGGAGKIALEQALSDCFSLENATADIDYGGRTDFSIVRELLELNGVDYSESAKDKLLNTYCSLLPDIMKKSARLKFYPVCLIFWIVSKTIQTMPWAY